MISIHALREEGDERDGAVYDILHYFYPRPPRGGRPFLFIARHYAPCISIHALREEGDAVDYEPQQPLSISIHALREEGDG